MTPIHSSIPFALSSFDLISVSRNLLLSCPSSTTLAVHQFNLDEDTGALKGPLLLAEWTIPDCHKISAVCWACPSDALQYALLGTRDGTILRIDLSKYGALEPVYVNRSLSSSFHSATISCIAAAPCGDGVFAVGYASGPIVIYQDMSQQGLITLHCIAVQTKIVSLSWHYSSKNQKSQSLAILREGSGRLQVWTVDVSSGSPAPRKIRDIPLPAGHSGSPTGPKFLQWSKSGKVTRVSNKGLVVADVRTKNVSSRLISVAVPVVSLAVQSSLGMAWVIDGDHGLSSYNLADGSLLHHTTLPFSVLQDSVDILDSPVVFLHKPSQVNKVVYKNKRAISSPRIESSDAPGSPEESPTILGTSSPMQNVTPPQDKSNSNGPVNQPLHLSMSPVKTVVNSLFPSVLRNLFRIPSQQIVSEFIPSRMTQEQYVISALFGSTFKNVLRGGDISEILQYCIIKEKNSFKALVFSLFLNDMSISQLVSTLKKCTGNKKYSDRLVVALLSIGSISRNLRYSSTTTGSSGSTESTRFCDKALVDVVQDLLGDLEESSADDIHLVCSYMVSMGFYLEARQIYVNAHYFLEAIVVCLLCKAEFASVLTKWCLYLRSTSQNQNLPNYLTDVCTSVTVVPCESTPSGSSFDENPFDEIQFAKRLAEYSLDAPHSALSTVVPNQLRTTEVCAAPHHVDDVAIFSPDGVPEDYGHHLRHHRTLSYHPHSSSAHILSRAHTHMHHMNPIPSASAISVEMAKNKKQASHKYSFSSAAHSPSPASGAPAVTPNSSRLHSFSSKPAVSGSTNYL